MTPARFSLRRTVWGMVALLVLGSLLAWARPAHAAALRWHGGVRIESANLGGLQGISCPSTGLCVAVDASGDVLHTARPTGGRRAWSRAVRIDRSAPLTGISCPSVHLCVAVDENGSVYTSTVPSRTGTRYWRHQGRIDYATAPDGGRAGLVAVACHTTKLCVAVDDAAGGDVFTTTRPLSGAAAWRHASVGGALTSVSCPGVHVCLIAGTRRYVSSNPAGDAGWRAIGSAPGSGVFSAIGCPSLLLCVAVGYGDSSTGFAQASSNPRTGGWRTSSVQAQAPGPWNGVVDAVACASRSLCVALDDADEAFTSTNPVAGGWSAPKTVRSKPHVQSNAVTCTRSFCLVVDSAGFATTGVVSG